MEDFLLYINSHVALAPYLICGLLFLAGLNIPVSEDLMVFTSAVLAAKNPEYKTQLFIWLFIGAYGSDIISYWLGRFLGPKLWNIKFFKKMVSQERVSKLGKFYNKNGFITLLVGRFIPFGVRNALFITAGLSRLNFGKFALYDFIACSVSTVAFFNLYYTYGEAVIEYVKKGNIIIFSIAAFIAVIFFIKNRRKQNT